MSQSSINRGTLAAMIMGLSHMPIQAFSSNNFKIDERSRPAPKRRTNFGIGHNDRMLRLPHQGKKECARRVKQGVTPNPQAQYKIHHRYDAIR